MKQTIGRARTCVGKFACIFAVMNFANGNESGQVKACLGKYSYICSFLIGHPLLWVKCIKEAK